MDWLCILAQWAPFTSYLCERYNITFPACMTLKLDCKKRFYEEKSCGKCAPEHIRPVCLPLLLASILTSEAQAQYINEKMLELTLTFGSIPVLKLGRAVKSSSTCFTSLYSNMQRYMKICGRKLLLLSIECTSLSLFL